MSTIILRPQQTSAIAAVRQAYREKARAPLLVAPCGFGKTVCFAEITRGAMQRGNRTMIIAHRIELIDQISKALNDFDVPHGFIAAQYPSRPDKPVQVASIQTLLRRLENTYEPQLIVLDEAHHATSGNSWGKVVAAFPAAKLLGVTATPVRMDGHGLGHTFDRMILGPTTQELIDAELLSPMRVFAPMTPDTSGLRRRGGEYIASESAALMDKPSITGDCITHYRKYADGKRAVVFCVSVAHAVAVCDGFRAAGIAACVIDGTLERGVRREYIERFRSGNIRVLVSCDIVSEGFDVPSIECGISLRPTASRGLWYQQIGRCLRTAPGKSVALILDHAGNSLRHGLPTDPITWSLDKGIADQKPTGPCVRVCPKCFAANRPRATVCSECAAPFPIDSREVEQREGELRELEANRQRIEARVEQGSAKEIKDLIAVHIRRGRNPGTAEAWARHVIAGREKKRLEAEA